MTECTCSASRTGQAHNKLCMLFECPSCASKDARIKGLEEELRKSQNEATEALFNMSAKYDSEIERIKMEGSSICLDWNEKSEIAEAELTRLRGIEKKAGGVEGMGTYIAELYRFHKLTIDSPIIDIAHALSAYLLKKEE